MIKIIRSPEPDIYKIGKIKKAQDALMAQYDKSERQERFKFDTPLLRELRDPLKEMCRGKCCYCESKISVSSYGEIENYRPKGGARGLQKEYAPLHYFWLAYDWNNLFISCQTCNQKFKRDLFPLEDESKRAKVLAVGKDLVKENPLLLQPCLDDPEDHLEFHSNGTVKPHSKRGKATIDILGLNRDALVQQRRKEADGFLTKLQLFTRTAGKDKDMRPVILDYVRELHSDHPSQEYVAVQRAVFEKWYEKNKTLWERIKKTVKDKSKTKTSEKKGPVSAAEKKKINIIEKDILQLKRFSIKKIHISNFKSVEDLVLTIPPVKPPVEGKEMQESWLLLLGDNGIGKSTILQALALALAGKKQLDKLDLDVTDFLRRGKLKGFVKIESYEHDNVIELNFNKKGFTTKLTEAPTFIMGYGSTRLLPKNNVQPDKDKEPFLNIRNLFDYSVSLIDPEKWLSSVDKKEFDDRVAPAFFDVLALKGDDKVSLIDGKIVIKQYGNDSELEDNSDGYKTVVALVADMMHSLSTDSANYHNSYGIVLLDEIGNHLHPRWRMKIVSALRRAFPRLQFIVTTHEPLCVRGLAHGEVVVMVRDEKQNIRSLDSSVLPDHSLMRVEQLLTSDLFGLINVLDEETEKSYEEYFKLLSKKEENKTEEDKASLKNLSEQLNKTPLGDTIPQQIYYEAINQRYVKKLNEEGFKAKETVKQETLDEVMALIKDQKLSW